MRSVLAYVLLLSGCNVFDALEDCSRDDDCALGQRCHPAGRFCELDRTPVRIGVTLDLSGDLGEPGRDLQTGVEAAAAVIDEAGGVLDRDVEFVVLDDEGDVELARANVAALIEQGVVGIVGPLTSGQAVAAQPVAAAASTLLVSPTAGTPCLSFAEPAGDRYFFRTISTMRTGSGAAIPRFARERPDGGPVCSTMAIVRTDDETGAAFADAVQTFFTALGGTVVGEVVIPPELQLEYDAEAQALTTLRPDCALLASFPEVGAAVVRALDQARTADPWPFFWLGTTGVRNARFLELTRVDPVAPTPNLAEGMYGGDTDSTPPTEEYLRFRTLYNGLMGRDPASDTPLLVANAFDAAILVALATEKAGTTRDGTAVRDGLQAVSGTSEQHRVFGPTEFRDAVARIRRGEEIHYRGASSDLVFDDRGTVSNPTVIWTVTEGTFAEIVEYDEETTEALNALVPPLTDPPFCE